MASARNIVIAGENVGQSVSFSNGDPRISIGNTLQYLHSYELITDEQVKSAASGIGRGIIGGALLGTVGALVGVMSAKSKGIYTVAIEYATDKLSYDYGYIKKSLIEVNEKIYKMMAISRF